MLPPVSPPYALAASAFRFPALAALAGRTQLGGEREVALACLMAARLAAGALRTPGLPPPGRTARAAAARLWLASLALPAAMRAPLARLVEATAVAGREAVGEALRVVIEVTAPHVDAAAFSELAQLADDLEAP